MRHPGAVACRSRLRARRRAGGGSPAELPSVAPGRVERKPGMPEESEAMCRISAPRRQGRGAYPKASAPGRHSIVAAHSAFLQPTDVMIGAGSKADRQQRPCHCLDRNPGSPRDHRRVASHQLGQPATGTGWARARHAAAPNDREMSDIHCRDGPVILYHTTARHETADIS